jgi:hypothetical protein
VDDVSSSFVRCITVLALFNYDFYVLYDYAVVNEAFLRSQGVNVLVCSRASTRVLKYYSRDDGRTWEDAMTNTNDM